MANKFVMVGLCGLAVSIVCLGAAAAIGGKALRSQLLQNNDIEFSFLDGDVGPRCNFAESGKEASRDLAWTGADRINIALPATVHYRRGSGDAVVVRGDSAVLDHVRIVRNDQIRLDCRGPVSGELDITLPGRVFRSFGLAGKANMTLEDIDQPELDLMMGGSTQITARGKIQKLDVKMGGSNKAWLGGLQTEDSRVYMAGSNDAEVFAKGDLTVHIGGSGKVQLKTEPRHIESHIAGSGRIVHDAAS